MFYRVSTYELTKIIISGTLDLEDMEDNRIGFQGSVLVLPRGWVCDQSFPPGSFALWALLYGVGQMFELSFEGGRKN